MKLIKTPRYLPVGLIGILILAWVSLSPTAAYLSPLASTNGVFAYDVDPKALVSITFDDASQTVYDTAFPILHSQDIPGTFYFLTGYLTPQWETQLRSLQNQGWEIGSHTVTHPDLTQLSLPALIEELENSKNALLAAGLDITGFAYPYGSAYRNGLVLRQVKHFYTYARSVHAGYNAPVIHSYALASQSHTNAVSIEMLKSWVDTAIANRQWVVIVLHTVDNSGEPYSISPTDLAELAEYIKYKVDSGTIEAVTMQEGFTRQSQTFWKPLVSPHDSVHGMLALTNGRILLLFGPQVRDYLYDGYQWVENGKLYYRELSGGYHVAENLTRVTLEFLSNDRASVRFFLTDHTYGDFEVTNIAELSDALPFAKIQVTAIQSSADDISAEKQVARRFSANAGNQVTDGLLESGSRIDQNRVRDILAFDQTTDLVRILTQLAPKEYSEYSAFAYGVFRNRPIGKASDLPYTWFMGGIIFDTLDLLVEAEKGIRQGGADFYSGADASPKTGITGIRIDEDGDTLTMHFTPPAQGNYILSIRSKGQAAGDRIRVRLDGGETVERTVGGTIFSYDNLPLNDLTAQSHSLILSYASGEVDVDYILLIPTSRTKNTPVDFEFPLDAARQVSWLTYLSLMVK